MESRTYHTPVLLQEVISLLLTSRSGCYVDGTLGGGGHSAAILERLDDNGRIIGIDLDDDALKGAEGLLVRYGNRFTAVKENFKNIKTVLSNYDVNTIQGVLLDLGVSSFQLDEPGKGFGYQSEGRLDMRMDRQQSKDAYYVVNQYDQESLAGIFWRYGEERNSRRIAREIIKQRAHGPIATTKQLAAVVSRAAGGGFINKTLARVFQAIRIEVNDELSSLRQALYDCVGVLNPGGRIAVISYHSLEDRSVKEFFREKSGRQTRCDVPVRQNISVNAEIKILTKKPVVASETEVIANPRSRSAKLRVAEKL